MPRTKSKCRSRLTFHHDSFLPPEMVRTYYVNCKERKSHEGNHRGEYWVQAVNSLGASLGIAKATFEWKWENGKMVMPDE